MSNSIPAESNSRRVSETSYGVSFPSSSTLTMSFVGRDLKLYGKYWLVPICWVKMTGWEIVLPLLNQSCMAVHRYIWKVVWNSALKSDRPRFGTWIFFSGVKEPHKTVNPDEYIQVGRRPKSHSLGWSVFTGWAYQKGQLMAFSSAFGQRVQTAVFFGFYLF